MRTVTLIREASTDQGTPGKLTFGNCELCSLELPWRDNHTGISSIPVGEYVCRMTYSNRFKRKTYEVFGVPLRSAIRIHSANWAGDSKKGFKCELNGCIALGTSILRTGPQLMLCSSRAAVAEFERLLGSEDFKLIIK